MSLAIIFKLDEHDFRLCGHAQRRPPGAGAVSRINLQIADSLQAVVELAPDAFSYQRPRKELPAVSMSGKLQRYAFFFADGQPYRRMQQQNAGAPAVKLHAAKEGAIALRMRGISIMHADQLQAVYFNFFIVQYPDAGPQQRRQVFSVAVKLFVVAGNVVHAELRPMQCRRLQLGRRCQLPPRFRQPFKITGHTVIEIARHQRNVRLKLHDLVHHAAHKAHIAYVAQMKVADQCGSSSTPLRRQTGQRDRDPRYARPGSVEDSINSSHQGRSECCVRNQRWLPAQARDRAQGIDDPAGNRRNQKKAGNSQPNGRNRIEDAHQRMIRIPAPQ